MGTHAFVDETMRGGYVMAAALVLSTDVALARKAIGAMVLPGQRRLHFCTERDSRRRQIMTVIRSLQPEVLIYDASAHRKARSARRACLGQLVEDLAARRTVRLTIERADNAVEDDRRLLFDKLREMDGDGITYTHQRAREEALLAIPDALAWCWTHRGTWRSAVAALAPTVRKV